MILRWIWFVLCVLTIGFIFGVRARELRPGECDPIFVHDTTDTIVFNVTEFTNDLHYRTWQETTHVWYGYGAGVRLRIDGVWVDYDKQKYRVRIIRGK